MRGDPGGTQKSDVSYLEGQITPAAGLDCLESEKWGSYPSDRATGFFCRDVVRDYTDSPQNDRILALVV